MFLLEILSSIANTSKRESVVSVALLPPMFCQLEDDSLMTFRLMYKFKRLDFCCKVINEKKERRVERGNVFAVTHAAF